jgi:hypothetical protein
VDLDAALTRIDPLVVDSIEPVPFDRRGGPRRAPLQDVRVRYGPTHLRLAVRVEEAPDARGMDDRADDLRHRSPKGAVPILAAPYLGPALRRRLERAGLGWLDSLGNIHVERTRPPFFLHVEARGTRASLPRFKGRLFSPAHSRVARALLEQPDALHRLKPLASVAGTDVSSVSRAMKVFTEANLVGRVADGWRVPDPAALLDAWLDHALTQPLTAPRRWLSCPEPPEAVIQRIARTARRSRARVAFTGAREAMLALGDREVSGPVEVYVDPFEHVHRLAQSLGAATAGRNDGNLGVLASPRGGAFVAVDPGAAIPRVGRMQLVTDLSREGRDSQTLAQELRDRWSL